MSKKGVSLVSGNISPMIGEKYTYHIADWYPDTPTAERNPAKVTWELFRKRSNGQFTSTHIKKLGDGSFTFGETSLGNKYRLEGYLHKPEGGGLIITPKQSKIPKISKVELLYVDDSKGSTFSFREKLRAKAYCVNMLNKDLVFTIWEDDAKNSGHNESNKPIDTKKSRVDENGLAVAEFILTKALMQKAIQGETDPKKLEFYVTVEYYRNKKHSSENIDVNNPFPQVPKQQTKATTSTKPADIPKAKGSPAEIKPISKKEEKRIGDRITEAGKELWDWWESKGTATKDKAPTVQKLDGKSPAIIKNMPKENKEGDQKICECEARVKAFIRMVRVGEGTGELIKSSRYNKEKKKKVIVYIPHDFQIGYTTAFGGHKITDLTTHPQIVYNKKSSAAGAYQVMRYTWWWLNGEELDKKNNKTGKYNSSHDYIKKYKIPDFTAESQDKICIALMKAQRPDLIKKIILNNIESAIKEDGSRIWASLPEDNIHSHYKLDGKLQPSTPLKTCLEHYNKFLKEELAGISNLHLKKGFLKEFGYECCGTEPAKVSLPPSSPLSTSSPKKGYDIEAAVNYINNNAESKSKGKCALYVRKAINAGDLKGLSGHAREYYTTNKLEKAGFTKVGTDIEKIQLKKGDIVAFAGVKGHPYGHIAMWNETQWVSDFKQKSFWVAKQYSVEKKYIIFRWQ